MVASFENNKLAFVNHETDRSDGRKGGDEPHARDTWGHPCEFFLSCLGFAVGFGNIWRFPYLAYKNGGAVFLIPFFIMLLIAGLPMFLLELALGQYVSLGPNVVFPEICPIFSGIGWAMLATTAMVAIYYNMIFAWSLFYTFASLTTELPWASCNNPFNSFECFTHEQSLECRKEEKLYYNKSCLSISSFCSLSHMESYNSTHCILGTNESTINHAERSVFRISASEDYYKNRMLGVSGTSWESMGGIRWELVGCLALSWIIVCLCLIKGVKSSGKVVYVSATFPYVLLTILFVRGITLEGAMKGIEFYIMNPDFSKLLEIQVWNDAATQIFYSLSAGFGGLITLSSYNKFTNNFVRDAVLISLINIGTSVFAGFVIFSILGFMAHEIQVEVKNVVSSDSGLAFIAYPAAVARMPAAPVWSIMFFVMLIFLGVDSQFTFVETLATGVFDTFHHLRGKKPLVMFPLCFIMFLLGLPLCLDGGVYMFQLIDYYSAGLSVLLIALCEIICIIYLYGFKKFLSHVTDEMKIPVSGPLYWYVSSTWLVITPLSLVMIMGFSVYFFEPIKWGPYVFPSNIQTLGWTITCASMILIPIMAIYVALFKKKNGRGLISATYKFCPADIRRQRVAKKRTRSENSFKYIYDNNGFVDGLSQVYLPRY